MSDTNERIYDAVRQHYARAVTDSCCGGSSCCTDTTGLYAPDETSGVPREALVASFGCGNPVAMADLREGEVVLDLGSGAGLDTLVSARRVRPGGRVYGLDMTDEMLRVARDNARRAGVENVEYLKGRIEQIPLPDRSVDVIISNCVVNLSPEKAAVFAEALRVLRPGGRLAIFDIVRTAELPEEVRSDSEAWAGCIAGAISPEEYARGLEAAGFEGVEVRTVGEYPRGQGGCCDPSGATLASAIIRAHKPGSSRV